MLGELPSCVLGAYVSQLYAAICAPALGSYCRGVPAVRRKSTIWAKVATPMFCQELKCYTSVLDRQSIVVPKLQFGTGRLNWLSADRYRRHVCNRRGGGTSSET
jgi:hypothetical protein